MGAMEPPQPTSCLPSRGYYPARSPDRAVANGTPSSSGPSGDTWRKSLPEGSGRKDLVGARRGWEVVGSRLYGSQVRRILIPWTERQTDRWTPHPL